MTGTVDCIAKNGIVDHMDDHSIYVKIMSMSACASCSAGGVCGSADASEKLIEIDRNTAPEVKVGDSVKVHMDVANGNLAVVYGYLLPFLLLIISLIVFVNLMDEGWAGLLSIAVLLPYYAGLFIFRDKLKKRFRFTLE